MRILVCGDRHWTDADVVSRVMLQKVEPGDVVVHGAARGADTIAGAIAANMEGVRVEAYPARWHELGRAAGPIRNAEMLKSGIDLVLAFHNDLERSKGTKDMVTRARKAGVPVEVYSSGGLEVLSDDEKRTATMKLQVNVLQGVRSAAIFEVRILSGTPIEVVKQLGEFERLLNTHTDHRWRFTLREEEV